MVMAMMELVVGLVPAGALIDGLSDRRANVDKFYFHEQFSFAAK